MMRWTLPVTVLHIGMSGMLARVANCQGTVADRVAGAFYGALVADALCLGSHYEYDAVDTKGCTMRGLVLQFIDWSVSSRPKWGQPD
jgi:hypothetical protein